MHIVVIGAGVVGLTSALALRRDGHRVTIIDRAPQVAAETSHANGGQLSFSYVAPMADPTVPGDLPGFLLHRDSPVRFRPRLDPEQWRWGMAFLRACTAAQSARTTEQMLRLSFFSRDALHALLAEVPLDFDHVRNGKLVVYSTPESFAKACRQAALQRDLGCDQQALDRDACLAAEPALAAIAPRLSGGILTPSEEAGDCRRFCQALRTHLEAGEAPVRFLLDTAVRGLLRHGAGSRRLAAVDTAAGPVEADAVVLAAGIGAAALARPLGLRLPIEAIKGYSLSVPLTDPAKAPRLSITDQARRVVYAPLGAQLRVAGMADLVGPDVRLSPARVALLRAEAEAAFPGAGPHATAEAWAGLRPSTPKGPPILGATPFDNLFLNVGHGSLGFTLAMGAARVVADAIAGRPPAIALDGFRLSDHTAA